MTPRVITNTQEPQRQPWPEDLIVQGGASGVVVVRGGENYRTAFVEVFPPKSFIRGEGPTVADAEKAAWEQYQRMVTCPGHPEHGPFNRRHYHNGAGFCEKCGCWFSGVLEPLPEPPAVRDPQARGRMLTVRKHLMEAHPEITMAAELAPLMGEHEREYWGWCLERAMRAEEPQEPQEEPAQPGRVVVSPQALSVAVAALLTFIEERGEDPLRDIEVSNGFLRALLHKEAAEVVLKAALPVQFAMELRSLAAEIQPEEPDPEAASDTEDAYDEGVDFAAGLLRNRADALERQRFADGWCDCQAVAGTVVYPGPWHPAGDSTCARGRGPDGS